MAARDLFHSAVKVALQKEQWVITDDPLKLEVGAVSNKAHCLRPDRRGDYPMDKLAQYRAAIEKVLTEYVSVPIASGEIDSQLIFDKERDRYQVVSVGWVGHRRVHGCVLHLDIINEKIWVQHNTTELQIGQELVSIGIPREDIILGFQAPYMRQYTDFGVA
jgi:XisI protein/XisH protein